MIYFNMIVDDRLKNKKYKEDLEDNVSLVNLNIDLLISIIEDINLFDKPFSEFKSMYNYKMENYTYEMYILEDGKEKYETMFTTNKKLKSNATYIHGRTVKKMLKFSKNEIIFIADTWDEDEKGNDIRKEVKIVIRLMKNVVTTISKTF